MSETQNALKTWPLDCNGNPAQLRGEYAMTYEQAVKKQQEIGAERLIYLPETKTAFFVMPKASEK